MRPEVDPYVDREGPCYTGIPTGIPSRRRERHGDSEQKTYTARRIWRCGRLPAPGDPAAAVTGELEVADFAVSVLIVSV